MVRKHKEILYLKENETIEDLFDAEVKTNHESIIQNANDSLYSIIYTFLVDYYLIILGLSLLMLLIFILLLMTFNRKKPAINKSDLLDPSAELEPFIKDHKNYRKYLLKTGRDEDDEDELYRYDPIPNLPKELSEPKIAAEDVKQDDKKTVKKKSNKKSGSKEKTDSSNKEKMKTKKSSNKAKEQKIIPP